MIRAEPEVKAELRDKREKVETWMIQAAVFHGSIVASHSCTFGYYCINEQIFPLLYHTDECDTYKKYQFLQTGKVQYK